MKRFCLLSLSVILLVVGCSREGPALPKTVPVKGRVTFAAGDPLRAGRVSLQPKDMNSGIEAWAEIQPDGNFTLTTYELNDGAVPGDYVITVAPYSYKTGNLKIVKDVHIPKRYWDADTSGLTAVVSSAGEDINVRLEKP